MNPSQSLIKIQLFSFLTYSIVYKQSNVHRVPSVLNFTSIVILILSNLFTPVRASDIEYLE